MHMATAVEHTGRTGVSAERWSAEARALSVDTAELGLWMFLASVTMLFAGFTSAYLVRQTTGSDWQPMPLPAVLWLNTVLLGASSVTIERARRAEASSTGWLLATAALGVAFLAGQVSAWQELAASGVFLPSHPHSSFFYILTGAHGIHLLGGLGALAVALAGGRRGAWPRRARGLKLCALYWHFMGALWLYLFLVLFVF